LICKEVPQYFFDSTQLEFSKNLPDMPLSPYVFVRLGKIYLRRSTKSLPQFLVFFDLGEIAKIRQTLIIPLKRD